MKFILFYTFVDTSDEYNADKTLKKNYKNLIFENKIKLKKNYWLLTAQHNYKVLLFFLSKQ